MVLVLPKLRPIPDDILRAIGLVAVEWTNIENTLGRLLGDLLALGTQASAVTTHIPFRTRIDIANTYARERPQIEPELARELSDLLKQIDANRSERNLCVHGEWRIHPRSGRAEVSQMSAHGKIAWRGGHVTAQNLITLADEIVSLNEALEALGQKLFVHRD